MANKKTGVEYAQIPIDNTGIVPIDYSRQYNYQLNPRFEFGAGAIPGRGIRQVVGDVVSEDTKFNNALGDVSDMSPSEYMQGLASAQSGWNKLGRGFVNMLGTAATTYVSDILGLPIGIAEAISSGEADRVWNNVVTNYGQNLLQKMNEANPIYRRQGYEDLNALQRLGTSEWWADNIQSVGFTLGTIGAALTTGGIMSGLGASSKLMGAFNVALSSYGEAAIEATNKKNDGESQYDYAKTQLQQQYDVANMQLDSRYRQARNILDSNRLNNPAYDYESKKLDADYVSFKNSIDNKTRESLQELEKDRYDYVEAGNLVFATNMALLTLTNAFEFGNLFTRGITGQRRVGASFVKGSLEEGFEGTTKNEVLARTAGRYLATGIAEGGQELSQNVLQQWGELYSKKHNGFQEAAYDSEAISYANDLVDSFTSAITKTMGDQNAWSEAMSGFLTGMLFGGADGSGYFANTKKAEESQSMAEKLNDWMQKTPENKAYYKGLVRKLALEKEKEKYLDSDNIKGFKDAESAQFISDLLMFYQAGRTDVMKEILNTSVDDMSDEEINQLIESTSTNGEGVFMSNGNKKSVQEVRAVLKDNIQTLQEKAQIFEKKLDLYTTLYPTASEDTLEELLFLDMQSKDTIKRRDAIVDELFVVYSDKITSNLSIQDTRAFEGVVSKQQFAEALSKDSKFTEAFKRELSNPNSELDATTQKDYFQKIDDVSRLDNSIKEYNEGLKKAIQDITKTNQVNQSNKEKAKETKHAEDRKVIKDRLAEAKTLTELKDIISTLEDEDVARTVIEDSLKEMADSGNALAKNRKQVNAYQASVSSELSKIKTGGSVLSDETLQDARALLTDRLNKAESFDEATQDNVALFSKQVLRDLGISEDEVNRRYNAAVAALQVAIANVKTTEAYKKGYAIKSPVPPRMISKQSAPATTGSDNNVTVPSVNITAGQKPQTPSTPAITSIGNITTQEVANENDTLNKVSAETASIDNIPTNVEGKRIYYKPAIPEYDIEDVKKENPIFRPFNVAKTWANKIYTFLFGKNAFSYVNSGSLKEGDEIHFMVLPEDQFKLDNYPATIFLVKKVGEEWQIVGSLNQNNLDKWEGLQELTDKIHKEWQDTDQTKPYITSYFTHVTQVMNGQVPTQSDERTLKNIPGIETVKFGVMMNSGIKGNVDSDKILQPNTTGKEGHVYMLIKGADGMYKPMACRTRYFNSKEFNITNPTVSETPIAKKIIAAIKELAEVSNDTERSNAVGKLSKLLYLGDLHVDLLINDEGKLKELTPETSDKTPVAIKLRKVAKDSSSQDKVFIINLVNNPTVATSTNTAPAGLMEALAQQGAAIATSEELSQERPVEDVASDILSAIIQCNLPLQVDVTSLKNDSYIKELVDSDVLTSNVQDATVHNSFFTVNALDKEGNELQALELKPKQAPEEPAKPAIPVTPTTSLQSGQTVSPVGGTEGVVEGRTKEVKIEDIPEAQIKESLTFMQIDDKISPIDENTSNAVNELVKGTGQTPHKRYIIISDGLTESVQESLCITIGTTKDGKPIDIAIHPQFSSGLNKNAEPQLVGYTAEIVYPNGNTSSVINGSLLPMETLPVSELLKKLRTSEAVATIQPKLDSIGSSTTVFTEIVQKFEQPKEVHSEQEVDTTTDELDVDDLSAFEDTSKARKVSNAEPVKEWNAASELRWLKKVLPQLTSKEHLSILNGVKTVASKGALAWGKYQNGLITLGQYAAEGTLYHEAFHAVFDLYLSKIEQKEILAEARELYGNLSNEELEEKLAEGFRQYTQDRQNRSFGQRIIRFFKDLYNKVMNYNKYSSRMNQLYRDINQGKFVQDQTTLDVPTHTDTSNTWKGQETETVDLLKSRGWTEDSFNSMSEELKQHILRCAGV